VKSSKLAVLSIAVISALGLAQAAAAGGRPDLVLAALNAGKAQHVPGELLVQFKAGASAAEQKAVLRGLGASQAQTVRGNLQLVRLPAGMAVANAVRALSSDRVVDFAEPNWIYQHNATSNDTYVVSGQLWGMTGTYGSQAANAWNEGKTDCSGVVVGVIDEGIYFSHPDIAANIWTNPADAADGVDNDGNGYVDDIHGWDFDGNSNNINSGGANDDHGTHVTGTIAGVGGNGAGVAGMCWSGIKVVNGRFLGRRGGTTANAILAVDYMTGLKAEGVPIVATNNSWGGGGFSQGLLDAINRANTAGILFVAAAGNSGANNDTTASYPSNYEADNVIAVAALESSGAIASYSQYGKVTVDLGAPGSGIISTVPKSSKGAITPAYASYSGTSMATPHVTGAVALYKKLNPAASAAAIKAAILGSAVPTASLQNKTVTGGRLDVSGF
jgi:subtilisin family serine protease